MSSVSIPDVVAHALDFALSKLSPADRSLVADYLKSFPASEQLEALDKLVQLTWRQIPVGVREFVVSPDYMNMVDPNSRKPTIYPRLLDDLEELFEGPYVEAICTGGIGWGKSSLSRVVHLYQLYQLGCMHNPARAYNLEATSRIVLINLAYSKVNAEEVVFSQVVAAIDRSPWFKMYMPRKREKMDHLEFENGVWLAPFAANEKAIVGFDAIGGVMDEVNEMAYALQSTRKKRGEVIYDQAQTLRDALIRRMESRFANAGGKLPGILMQMSSSKFPGEYTERRAKERELALKDTGKTDIFYRCYSTWETQPWKYSATTFRVALGTISSAPLILDTPAKEIQAQQNKAPVYDVPDNLLPAFKTDIHSSIRDYIGKSTAALHPFIGRVEKVYDAIMRGEATGLSHPFGADPSNEQDTVVVTKDGIPKFQLANFMRKHDSTRVYFAHSDLAKGKGTGDKAGVAIGHIAGYDLTTRQVPDNPNLETQLLVPHFVIDLMVQLHAPPDDEIRISTIKGFFLDLVKSGVRFHSISFDSWGSLSLIQDLKDAYAATFVGEVSVDRYVEPYQELKNALYEDRLDVYEHATFQREVIGLEMDESRGKVDHAPGSSKDVCDAVCGTCWAMVQYQPSERALITSSHKPDFKIGSARQGGRTFDDVLFSGADSEVY